MNALNTDSRKVETTSKILSFYKEEKSSDPNNHQSILLDFFSSCQNLCIWTLNTATREYLNNEQLQKGKQIDEWRRQVETTRKILSFHKEEKSSDPSNHQSILLDFFSSCQNLCIWTLNIATREYLNNEQLQKGKQIDEWRRQVVPSIAVVETYCRLMLISPHSLFRSLLIHLTSRNPTTLTKPGNTILVFEILNYRFLSLYRYQGKSKTLMYDVTKMISTL
ncbi:mediator of RNA polymerase II transcription subunit 23 isoform X1 [Nicotiana tabacum]|uniref:Mediator of RNA polymerase II transcription subunit 23 isoform X1 n=4 Tax=Nicotiana tabacum TaxID=4097 RepID=A0AC58UMZ5_TOBAC